MAVSDTDVKQIYQGNGSTTVFAIPFAFQSGDISHIKVYLRDETDADNITETLKTITTHYTLNSATVPTNVTMLSAPTSTQKLIIVRVSPLTQQTSFVGSGSFLASDIEKAFDRLSYQIQCLDEALDRSFKQALGDPTGFDATLPSSTAANKAGRGIFVNDAGTGLEYGPTAETVEAAEGYASDASDSASAASASASSASSSASNASSSATAAANSASSASTSATAAAASAAAAAASAASIGVPSVMGSRASPTLITAAGIAFTGSAVMNIWFVAGNGGAIDITSNPQIAAGTVVGQRLVLIGCHDTNTIKFENGTGLVLKEGSAEAFLFASSSMEFVWDGTTWTQVN